MDGHLHVGLECWNLVGGIWDGSVKFEMPDLIHFNAQISDSAIGNLSDSPKHVFVSLLPASYLENEVYTLDAYRSREHVKLKYGIHLCTLMNFHLAINVLRLQTRK